MLHRQSISKTRRTKWDREQRRSATWQFSHVPESNHWRQQTVTWKDHQSGTGDRFTQWTWASCSPSWFFHLWSKREWKVWSLVGNSSLCVLWVLWSKDGPCAASKGWGVKRKTSLERWPVTSTSGHTDSRQPCCTRAQWKPPTYLLANCFEVK